jgi:hypothetical protein
MRAQFIYEALGFTEDSDPIKDMEIGHDAQMAKLDKQYEWDWSVRAYEFPVKEKIIDIIEYRSLHLKIVQVNALGVLRDKQGTIVKTFYIAIPDTGEPYMGDGPYKWNTPEEAMKSGKAGLDNQIDD